MRAGLLILVLMCGVARAEEARLTKTYMGSQECNGGDQLLIARKPWHRFDIRIIGVSLTHRVFPPDPNAFAMVGSSGPEGDILVHVSGGGSENLQFQHQGFLFNGSPSHYHIDVHAFCTPGSRHEVWVTVHYKFPKDQFPPEFVEENDKLPELCAKIPHYCQHKTPKKSWFRRALDFAGLSQ